MGDFNSDLHRNKRFDKQLKNFLESNDLENSTNRFKSEKVATYLNALYSATLD